MTKPTLAVVLTTLALAASATTLAQRETRERHVFVSVTDHNNAPVSGLTTADFAVREDNVAREVLRVDPATDPMQIVLLIDDSEAITPVVQDLRLALKSFARDVVGASQDSQMSLITFGERPTKRTPFTSTLSILENGFGHIFGTTGSGAYFMDGIKDACKALKAQDATRPVIVAFVDEGGPEFSAGPKEITEDLVKESGASFWAVVDETRAPGSTFEDQNRTYVIADSTTKSGGLRDTILGRMALDATFKRLAARLTHEYRVTYSRPESLIPPQRLDVKLKRDGLKALAPSWLAK
jgi:hypothetical protein